MQSFWLNKDGTDTSSSCSNFHVWLIVHSYNSKITLLVFIAVPIVYYKLVFQFRECLLIVALIFSQTFFQAMCL